MKAQIFEEKDGRQINKIQLWQPLKVRALLSMFTLLMVVVCYGQNQVTVITNANQTENPNLRQYVESAVTSTLTYISTQTSNDAFVIGKITSSRLQIIAPFSDLRLLLLKGVPQTISGKQISTVFGDFNASALSITGPDASLINPSNIILPDGDYQICFLANNDNGCSFTPSGCNLSNPATGCANFTVACLPINGAVINTIANNPVSPFIRQSIFSGNITSNIQFNRSVGCSAPALVKLFGKLERLAPAPFTIALIPNYSGAPTINLNNGNTQITPAQQLQAFANFNGSLLNVTGIDYRTLVDSLNNLRLPGGTYRICYYARYLNSNGALAGNASNPSLGCATFNICGPASAPQFIQPVNNLNISSAIPVIAQTSPVVFSWTPPQSSCGFPPGGYLYDFEIRELYANQGVQDAINNPFVFRKFSLPSNTFLLDTLVNQYVLQRGKRYVIRVRATGSNPSTPIIIDNSGYSRTEAFQYGENVDITTQTPFGAIDPTLAYLKFTERMADYWDDAYTDILAGKRSDTLVPIKEFISLKLMQNGIGYGLDAIEIFYLLNPELINEKMVRLSYKAKMPLLPLVDGNKLRNFAIKYNGNLQPDTKEVSSYKMKQDSLVNLYDKNLLPESIRPMVKKGLESLQLFANEAATAERVTVNTINRLLAELLFTINSQRKTGATLNTNHIAEVVNDLVEITSQPVYSSAYNQLLLPNKSEMQNEFFYAASYKDGPVQTGFNIKQFATRYEDFYFASKDRILPFDIVVYRSKTPPAGPVLSEPNLNEAYRIFYTPSSLYNNRNPDINALVSPDLASTTQVPLPQTLGYKFWTLNMLNHSRSNATNVEVKDIFINNRKKGSTDKRLSILLKVN